MKDPTRFGDAGRAASSAGIAAARALAGQVAGEVHTGDLRRWLYSTDASIYRVVPDAVLVARSVDDLAAAAVVAAEFDIPLSVRGAGTSLAGQTLGGGIAVDCFHLDRIVAIDPERHTATVEPGVIQASLNRAAAPFGLEFGPDTSTVDQATIGGMVANNSSGSRSIVYGESKDKVRRVTALLAGGGALTFGAVAGADDLAPGVPVGDPGTVAGDATRGDASGMAAALLASGLRGQGGDGLVAALALVRERRRAAVDALPQTRRWTSGYNLRELFSPRPNLARLLAGSEGTLALFAELEVALDPRPECRVGAALTFATLRRALEANVAILDTGPSAVELLDLDPLRRSPNLVTFGLMTPLLVGDEQAMLTVEYQGDEAGARAGLSRLRALLPALGTSDVAWLEESAELGEAAALRRAALPLLMGAPGAERPASFVEDTAVAPERLGDFVDDFQKLVASHGARASFTGHASAGCLHIRPLLDLKSAAGVERMAALAAEVGDLVADYHGVISGEHGCGRSRSWLLPRLLGSEAYGALVDVKRAFDPRGLLLPGVVVDGPPIGECLRFGPGYGVRDGWQPRLSFAAEGGFDLAVEKCFGAGLCKKVSGTMCPPAAATRDEARSTRARANALQAVLSGEVPLAAVGADDFRDVLGSCVACKACKTECPAGVDMAALKAEWLAQVRASSGTKPLARGIADFRRVAAAASVVAPVVNALASTRPARHIATRLGVARERPLPAFASSSLTRRLAAAASARTSALRGGAAPPLGPAVDRDRTAVLFVDCFVQYQEPHVGEALSRLLAAGGVTMRAVDAGCCGRTALSTGHIEKARAMAGQAVATLYDVAGDEGDVLFIEPSCLSMARDDWERLLPDEPRLASVAGASRPALALVAELAETGRLRFSGGGRALLHSHCHEKALGFAAATERALRAVPGLEVEVLDAGCCGMSGVFGYEAEHYQESLGMAERVLLPAVRGAGGEVAVLATGTSCRTQIGDLASRRALHPLEFLASRLVAD